jgi:hypothetical protein
VALSVSLLMFWAADSFLLLLAARACKAWRRDCWSRF